MNKTIVIVGRFLMFFPFLIVLFICASVISIRRLLGKKVTGALIECTDCKRINEVPVDNYDYSCTLCNKQLNRK